MKSTSENDMHAANQNIANGGGLAHEAVAPPLALMLQLTILDPEVTAALAEHQDGRARNEFATTCLKVGVLALRAARGQVDGDAMRREGERLMEKLAERLSAHRKDFEHDVSTNLGRFFDPKSGLFSSRVESLVKDDGELALVMQAQILKAQEGLSSTFADFIGQESPLIQALTPGESNKLLVAMRSTVDEVMQAEKAAILAQFSLDDPKSALSRLIRDLKTAHGEISTALETKLGDMVNEFSLDKPDSALSRLVQRVEQAQKNITEEFSLDSDSSALSRLRRELQTQFETQTEKQGKFQQEVRDFLIGLKARKEEVKRGTRHGEEFETALFDCLRRFSDPAGDITSECKNTEGLIPKCKKGDFVIELGADCAAAGARIAVEAKQSDAYTLQKTLVEIEQARRNRDATIGLFVHSARTAPELSAPLIRHGSDLVVVWDWEDERSDVNLVAGLLVAKALCVRTYKQSTVEAASFTAIDAAVEMIRKQLDLLEEIRTSTGTIKTANEKIASRADKISAVLNENLSVLTEQIAKVKTTENQ